MRIELTDKHKAHCFALGIQIPPAVLEVSEHEWEHAKSLWKKAAEDVDHDLKAIGHLAWKYRQEPQPAVPVETESQASVSVEKPLSLKTVERLLKLIAFLLLALLLATLFAPRAHAQWSQIKTVSFQNSDGTVVGLAAGPFTIKPSSGSWTRSGTTWTLTVTAASGSVAWDAVTNPVSGALTLTQFANGNSFLIVKRKTDTTPTGNYFDFQNAAGSSLCKLDITGAFIGCSFPYANLSGAPTLAANTSGTAHQFFSAYNSGTGAFTKTQPACGDLSDAAATCNTATASAVGLGSVTNDAQTKAAIVPNTAPAATQLLIGNAGGTAYAPVTLSGPVSVTSAGVTSVATLNQNTTGTAANLSGTPALPNGTTATTQTAADNTTKLATTAYVDSSNSTQVTAAANYTSGDLVQAAAANRTTSSSGIQTANVVTAASNFASGGLVKAAGANKTLASADLSGDVTTAGGVATTVAKVNGTSVPTNAAADQVVVTTASATGAWKSIPDCTDTGGNHLNYATATHTLSCGTSGGAGGGVSSISGGTGVITNSASTGAVTLTYSGTSGGIPYFSSASAISSSGALTANVLTKGGGAGAAPTNSLITDDGTAATYTGTGGYKSPIFTSTGSTAGFFDFPQGTTSAAVAPCNTATSVCIQAPVAVTSYLINLPGAAANGISRWSNSASVVTESVSELSGDASTSGSNAVTVSRMNGVGVQRVTMTADWTCGTAGTSSSCVAATIIGTGGTPLTITLPSVAASYHLHCYGVVGQATAATANQWNLLTATNGATNVMATYDMGTAATAQARGAVTGQASTTTTFQITPSWTLGGTGTKMPFFIDASIEGASASGTVVSLQLVAPTVADVVTIYRGASCSVAPF
jgi:hypothetical protein